MEQMLGHEGNRSDDTHDGANIQGAAGAAQGTINVSTGGFNPPNYPERGEVRPGTAITFKGNDLTFYAYSDRERTTPFRLFGGGSNAYTATPGGNRLTVSAGAENHHSYFVSLSPNRRPPATPGNEGDPQPTDGEIRVGSGGGKREEQAT